MKTAIFGGGCFWCLEAVFQRIPGVIEVIPGYAGGSHEDANYSDVCKGTTDHAEVIKINFNEETIGYTELLSYFFDFHDPTTLNAQGNDRGTQYRSIVFYSNLEEKNTTDELIDRIEEESIFLDKIVTEVTELNKFYEAETYHRNYYENNQSASYCQILIAPKVQKLMKKLKGS
ncbi:peptide-methionine (S)-S-oxide reductase MsrA [Bacteriovoracaceae bacterium]|nr:peptide-methionine (S)-S-oxide reductase MsrA [Bacteriovoracaceae bacterium]